MVLVSKYALFKTSRKLILNNDIDDDQESEARRRGNLISSYELLEKERFLAR